MFELIYIISSVLTLSIYAYLYKRVMEQFGDIYIEKPKEGEVAQPVSTKIRIVTILMRITPVLLCLIPIVNLLVLALEIIFLLVISRNF